MLPTAAAVRSNPTHGASALGPSSTKPTVSTILASMRGSTATLCTRAATTAVCLVCSCFILLLIPATRAQTTAGKPSTKDTKKDHYERHRLPLATQRLQVHHDQDQRIPPASAGVAKDAGEINSQFYDRASWTDDDKQLLSSLLGRMGAILPHIDRGILHERYQQASSRRGGVDGHQPPRRRLTEEVTYTADDGVDEDDLGRKRRLRKKQLRKKSRSESKSKSKSKSKSRNNTKNDDKWDDEATVYWGKKDGDDDDSNSRKNKKSRDDKKRKGGNKKKQGKKKNYQHNGDTGDDFYAGAHKKRKDDSRKSRKKDKDSRKVDDHDYSESDDKSGSADNKKKKKIKSRFQPHFDESFRDSQDDVDIFHDIIKKKTKANDDKKRSSRKKDHRRLGRKGDKSSKNTKGGGSSSYGDSPTFEPTYEPTYEDSLEKCPEHYYYDSDDEQYYPDFEHYQSKSRSSKSAKRSKGSTNGDSSHFKSAKRTIRKRHLKSGKSSVYGESKSGKQAKGSSKVSKSGKASKGSSHSLDNVPCYPPGGNSTDGFEEYVPSRGNCEDGDGGGGGGNGVPCPSADLRKICDKYDNEGSFRECLEACEPSFCCIHDALSPPAPNSNYLAPNCNEDVNCAQYSYCYIAWWKLADTVGPAIYLRLEQTDDFYDVNADEIEGDQTGDPFYQQFMLHHFNDVDEIIEAGTDNNGDFKASTIFDNPDFWDSDI